VLQEEPMDDLLLDEGENEDPRANVARKAPRGKAAPAAAKPRGRGRRGRILELEEEEDDLLI